MRQQAQEHFVKEALELKTKQDVFVNELSGDFFTRVKVLCSRKRK